MHFEEQSVSDEVVNCWHAWSANDFCDADQNITAFLERDEHIACVQKDGAYLAHDTILSWFWTVKREGAGM